MRSIVLDTETTGLDPQEGHRIVEIGCLELHNHLPTGKTYHVYLNPQRVMPVEAFRVHGLSDEFLADKPLFSDIVDEFLDFVQDTPLVIHNAKFDMKFLNAELKSVNRSILPMERAIDTLMMAKKKFPGAMANLDALCRRFNIDNSNRTLHGALLDAQLLAEVYLELMGGRQSAFGLETSQQTTLSRETVSQEEVLQVQPPRSHEPLEKERDAHASFLDKLKNPLWKMG